MDLYKPVSFEKDSADLSELKWARLSLGLLEGILNKEEKKLPLVWLQHFNKTKRALLLAIADIDELKDKLFMEEDIDS